MFLVEMSVVTSSRILTMLASLMTSTLREDFVDDDQLGQGCHGWFPVDMWNSYGGLHALQQDQHWTISAFGFHSHLDIFKPLQRLVQPSGFPVLQLVLRHLGPEVGCGWMTRPKKCVILIWRTASPELRFCTSRFYMILLGQFWWPGTVDPSWNRPDRRRNSILAKAIQSRRVVPSAAKPHVCLCMHSSNSHCTPGLFSLQGKKNGNMVWLHMDYNCAWKPSIPQSLNHFLKIEKDHRGNVPKSSRH